MVHGDGGACRARHRPSASAVWFFGGNQAGSGSGDVTIAAEARISGVVADTAADGSCVSLKGNWDYFFEPDISFTVATACGKGTNATGIGRSTTRTGARDFEVRVCPGGGCVIIWEGTGNDA